MENESLLTLTCVLWVRRVSGSSATTEQSLEELWEEASVGGICTVNSDGLALNRVYGRSLRIYIASVQTGT